jgi:hypothetical protein
LQTLHLNFLLEEHFHGQQFFVKLPFNQKHLTERPCTKQLVGLKIIKPN